MAKYSGRGWHFQSQRHSNARRTGRAGGKYLVAVKTNNRAEIFAFQTKKGRSEFLTGIKKTHPTLKYATSEEIKEKSNARVIYDPSNNNAWVDLGEGVKEKKRFIDLFSKHWDERPKNNREVKAKALRVAKERGIPLIEK